MKRKYNIKGYTILKFKKDMPSKYSVYYEAETDTVCGIVKNLDFICIRELAQFSGITTDTFIKEFENVFSEWFEIVDDAEEVRKHYSLVIADIYSEHHVSPFTDIEKHNEGIIKSMVDFAIFYKENS